MKEVKKDKTSALPFPLKRAKGKTKII